jgi:hypothetical protein
MRPEQAASWSEVAAGAAASVLAGHALVALAELERRLRR